MQSSNPVIKSLSPLKLGMKCSRVLHSSTLLWASEMLAIVLYGPWGPPLYITD